MSYNTTMLAVTNIAALDQHRTPVPIMFSETPSSPILMTYFDENSHHKHVIYLKRAASEHEYRLVPTHMVLIKTTAAAGDIDTQGDFDSLNHT